MITTGDEKPSAEEVEQIEIAKERSAALTHRYYQKKSTIKNVSLVKTMANFHNHVIKGEILTKPILMNSALGLPVQKRVIDTSIGKGGDLGRYQYGVEFLLGVDIDADGIRDPDEGAYRRYLDNMVDTIKNRLSPPPPMLFIIGDSSKSYANGNSGMDQEEADMLRATIGKVNPAGRVPPYVDGKCRNQLKDGADLITSMFSIHYYFETKDKWQGFLQNIRDNLKVGGFFVCCCFDGNFMTALLEDVEKGDSIQGVDETTNSIIWKITKQFDLGAELPETEEEGFGHAIDVEFLSIGSVHREYLVSYGLLLTQMNSIGCTLATPAECASLGIPGPSQAVWETYDDPSKSYASYYPMTEPVKQFSSFNRWYVFRRTATAPGAQALGPLTPKSPEVGPFTPKSPEYVPNSPVYVPKSPAYVPSSPAYAPKSPAYTPASPV
jgi:SAM-dependent methyltransferase